MAIALDKNLTLQDRIRLYLNEKMQETGKAYIPTSVEDIALTLREKPYDVYQALYRLKTRGEITPDKESDEKRAKIIGISVHRLEPSGRTYQRAATKAKADIAKQITEVKPSLDNLELTMPAISEYLQQKLAILQMRKTAEDSGLNPDEVITFEPNPFAEEGLLLLKLLQETHETLSSLKKDKEMMSYDLEAARRDIEYLKRERASRTRAEIIGAVS